MSGYPRAPWKEWSPGEGKEPWAKAKGGLVCPLCAYVTTKPDAHIGSALCVARVVFKKRAEAGWVETSNALLLLYAGRDVERDIIAAYNPEPNEPEAFEVGWYGRQSDALLAARSSLAQCGVGRSPSWLLRAAIVRRAAVDPTFLDAVEGAVRLGGKATSFAPDLEPEMNASRVAAVDAQAFFDGAKKTRVKHLIAYVFARLRATMGLPVGWWGEEYGAGVRAVVVRRAFDDPELTKIILAEARRDKFLQALIVDIKAAMDHAAANNEPERLPSGNRTSWRSLPRPRRR